MTLVRLPLPPAACTFARVFKIGGAYRTVFLNMRDELLYFSRMFLHPRLPVFPAHLFRRKHTVTHKGKIAAGKEAGFVRPVLHQLPLAERLIQPLRRIAPQAAEQHQVRATCHNINGVDLE